MTRPTVAALALFCGVGAATAKLPPLSDEQKAKAAETSARTAWSDKVGLYQLCQAMDKKAAAYRTGAAAAGKPVAAAEPTPACTDPGPFIAPAPPEQKPLEASGAHSPPGMATSPPSNNATSAEMTGPRK